MLKGDLSTTPLASLLIDLARETATGSLVILADDGDEAQLYLKQGQVYAVQVPGARPQLGSKLVSSGALAPEALADALEAQRTELQGWRLGELLVHLGYVEQTVVEAFVKEQVNDAMWDLMRWHTGRWRFRKNVKTREDVAPPMEVVDLLSVLRERGYEWETISSVVHGPSAIPVLSVGGVANPETVLDPEAWSMLCKIDGERSVSDLARDCGYTLFEAGHVIVSLVHAGLVDITEDVDVAGQTPYGASTLSSAWNDNTESAEGGRAWHDDSTSLGSDDAEGDALSRLARLVTEVATGQPAQDDEPTRMPAPERTLAEPWTRGVEQDESFAVALAKVSSALTDVLGPAESESDPFELPRGLRKPKKRTLTIVPEDPEWDRRAKLRSAAAAELATAHALAEALRPDGHHDAEPDTAAEFDTEAELDTAAGLESEYDDEATDQIDDDVAQAAAEEEAARVAAEEEAARVAAEEEAARVAAEEEAARVAAEQEAARLAAEEAARVAAEEEAARVAAEEAARLAAEEEAARLAAEEEDARLAAEEVARLAAEQEAARVAAEEEAARLAAEQEAARVAAEEEAARVAAEEAARLAAEEEAARLAAEEEAARLAAEEEAARLAAEEEAARLAAEEEAARLAAEEEAARLAAEHQAEQEAEAARISADREFARLAAEESDAVLAVAEEAARLEAEEDAAREQEVADAEAETAHRAADALERDEADLRAAEASALLGQLSAEPLSPMLTPAPEADSDDDDANDDGDVAERDTSMDNDDDLYPMQRNEDMADTAALLRELSSLGTEEGDADSSSPGPPQSPRPTPRPAAGADKKQRKKIGLFGL